MDRPPPMDKPTATDGVICPEATNKTKTHTPEKVYETKEFGKVVRRGILGQHRHRYRSEDCDYTGHPVPITPKPGVKKE